ncbi:hypothetical protein CF326_g3277 [Tilletia indica]|nr:hypothetical protein CF326_g3277 [Tilletia indica]
MSSTRSQLDYVDVPMTTRSTRIEISDDDEEGAGQDPTDLILDAEQSTHNSDDISDHHASSTSTPKTPRRATRRSNGSGRKQTGGRKRSTAQQSKAGTAVTTRTTRRSRAKASSKQDEEASEGPAANELVPFARPSTVDAPTLDANLVERLNAGEVAQIVRTTLQASVPSNQGNSETRVALAVKASIAACIAACLAP